MGTRVVLQPCALLSPPGLATGLLLLQTGSDALFPVLPWGTVGEPGRPLHHGEGWSPAASGSWEGAFEIGPARVQGATANVGAFADPTGAP